MLTIQKETWRQGLLLSHGASWLQANVYVINQGDHKIVIKDFSDVPRLMRCTFVRAALNNEIRAMQQLQSLHITPRYLGKVSDDAYAMEYIDGEYFKFKKHVTHLDFLVAMREAVKNMHNKGVVHNDLHSKNIIVANTGEFYFIDFSGAVFRSHQKGIFNKLHNKAFDVLALVDSAKIAALIKRYDSSYLTPLDNKMLVIKKYVSWLTYLWKKLINGPFLSKRTWQKRKAYFKKWANF